MMVKRTRSSGTRKPTGRALAGSLGETLDQVGFQPLGRRIVVHQHEAPRTPPASHWVGSVIEFLKFFLPTGDGGGWEHHCISAYKAGCDALVALGAAEATTEGATPVTEPELPAILPRWDDVATVVIMLAAQSGLLEYRPFAGTRAPSKPIGALRSNIRAAYGSGPAYLAFEVVPVFMSLGLVLDGRWTEIAETILWRDFPEAWGIDFTTDRRFVAACEDALATIPEDIEAVIKKFATVSEEDIIEWLGYAEKYAPSPKTRADALKSLHFWARHGLDGVFDRRWRLSHGWLSVGESERTLHFHHDPVTINMRCKFMSRYMPEFPFLAE